MKKLFFFLCTAALVASVASCSSCSKKDEAAPTQTQFEASMTNADSVAVVAEINKFFDLLKAKDTYGACGMLVKITEKNGHFEFNELDNQELEERAKTLKLFPVEEYHIDYLKFHEYYKNEAQISVTIAKGDPSKNIPDATTKMYLIPVNITGAWKLALLDSREGQRSLVDGDSKDSLSYRYEQQVELQKAHKAASQKK